MRDSPIFKLVQPSTTTNMRLIPTLPWVPQRDVLRHRAVGCFLTHAGWNSTLEAAVEGVPMVCWLFFGDHLINSRNVGAVWPPPRACRWCVAVLRGARRDVAQDGAEPGHEDWHQQHGRSCSLNHADERTELRFHDVSRRF